MKNTEINKHYEVASIEEAWELANKIFPTDYMQDMKSTENAGYPIYFSTCSNYNNLWISDLGDRLELNMLHKEFGYKTITIWVVTFEDRIEASSKRICEKYGFKVRVA